MPSKDDVEKFKEVFKQVAKETEVLASRGITPGEVTAPVVGEPVLPWKDEEDIDSNFSEFDKLAEEETFTQLEEPLNDEVEEAVPTTTSRKLSINADEDNMQNDFSEDMNTSDSTSLLENQQSQQSFPSTENNKIREQDFPTDNFLDEMDSLFTSNQGKETGLDLSLDKLLSTDDLSEGGKEISPNYFSPLPTSHLSSKEKEEDDLFSLDKKESEEDETTFPSELNDNFSFESDESELQASGTQIFEKDDEIGLSNEDYHRFYQKLLSFPKNLRLGVAEVVIKPELSEREVSRFVNMVIREKNYWKIARKTGAILGKVIILPHSYYQAQELARQKEKLWYNIRSTVFPVLQKGILLNVAVFVFLYISFRFGIEPWQASSYFKEGLIAIKEGRSEDANALFRKAYYICPWDDWFLRYASAYEDQRNYDNAIQKYEEMLTQEPFSLGAEKRRRTRFNHSGYLAYSRLKTLQGFYKEADDLLQFVISENVQDYDGWLARGDNYMAWAEEDSLHYTDALRSYASVIGIHGDTPKALFKLLNYYIKTDDEAEAYRLYQYIENRSYDTVEAPIYTDYARYLLEKDAQLADYVGRKAEIYRVGKFSVGQEALVEREFSHIKNKDIFYLDDIGNLLRRSIESDPSYPPTYYYLSRYFKRSGNQELARQSIEEAVKYFYYKKSLSPEENYLNVLSFKELGRTLDDSQDYLSSRQYYQRGIELYENLLHLGVLSPSRELAELFELQGNSYYRVYEDVQAKFFFEKASKQGYSTPNMEYSLANISYLEGDYPKMISYLFGIESVAGYRVDASVLYSMGTALLDNQDQESAIGYYRQLLSLLDQRRGIISVVDLGNPDHKDLIERTIMTLNNLGVAEISLAKGMTQNHYFLKGINHLAQAEELFDISTRQGPGMKRFLEKNLASLNLQEVWKGKGDLIRYQELPRYLEAGLAVR